MKLLLRLATVLLLFTTNSFAGEGGSDITKSKETNSLGLINLVSSHDVETTASRFKALLEDKGMNIFSHINHTEGAKKVGKELRPTELIIFGNPKIGTVLMQCNQSVAIDLPQKALIWEDDSGKVWLSYNDPSYLAKRHDLKGCEETIKKISKALNNFTQAAVSQ